jgi:FG-GAP-like repeat
MNLWSHRCPARWAWTVLCFIGLLFQAGDAAGQLFTNLQDFVFDVRTGNSKNIKDGPKGIATCDFDGDGNADLAVSDTAGVVTVYFGEGTGRFGRPVFLETGVKDLRGITCADFNGDQHPDIATAAPNATNVFLFFYQAPRAFSAATPLPSWYGARNLTAGDFDGDGLNDLAVAGPNLGLRQYRGLGDGKFQIVTELPALNSAVTAGGDFPKPVYSLKTLRPPGSLRDELVATHAESHSVWFLEADSAGALQITGTIANRSPAHALAVGPLFHPVGNATNDLVTIQRDGDTIELHAGLSSSAQFDQAIRQQIHVQDPRAVEILDLNHDGWNDLAVVLRNSDTVLTYANSNGVFFYLARERPVGNSPREIVSADFNHDTNPDVAVMNRNSSDVTLLLGYTNEVGFTAVDHLYLVDGNVAGLAVYDFNRDGLGDVIQLHRASGDFSVWLMQTNGTLAPPVYYTIGDVPGSQVIVNVNQEPVPIPDLVAVNLGNIGLNRSSVSVRLGLGDGTFGPEKHFELPEGEEGRLFALVPADLDGNGTIDLVAGFLDSRVAFFEGHGDGTFSFSRTHPFVRLARGLVAGDFDQDGDMDLAGVGADGAIWVVENEGNLLEATELKVKVYPSPDTNALFRTIKTVDFNRDQRLDLLVGGGDHAYLYQGVPQSMNFMDPTNLAGTAYPVSEILSGDFDSDGTNDLVVSCSVLDCLTVFTLTTNGNYAPALPVDVPASQFLAAGDLDGDGKLDLVGSGKVLWTALSSRRPFRTSPLIRAAIRPGGTNLVINEFLAINTAFPVKSDGDRLVDWIEIYNGNARAISLFSPPGGYWRLRSVAAGDGGESVTNDYTFPPTAFLAGGAHLLVYCSETNRTLYHTGWRLSGDGGTLSLINPDGVTVDSVVYLPQEGNVSYSRFHDGLDTFVFSPFPSPGEANPTFAQTSPGLRFEGVDLDTLRPEVPIRFLASVREDVAVARLRMRYQRLDISVLEEQSILLYDDGLHGDGQVSDNSFAADLPVGFPAGAELQFYFEITDLNDQTATVPDEAELGKNGEPGNAFQMAVSRQDLPLEISECVPQNRSGLKDETGGTPDWVEVRNFGLVPQLMDDIVLTRQIGENSRYHFPPGTVLGPGEYFVVFCDDNSDQGDRHAPFSLRRSGDQVLLSGLTPLNKSRTVIDYVRFDDMKPDQAWARLGQEGEFHVLSPTPGTANVTNAWLAFPEVRQGTNRFIIAFPTKTNFNYEIDQTPSLTQPDLLWNLRTNFSGNGIEKGLIVPMTERQGYYRMIRTPKP